MLTLHYITLHYITLHYITLHYITLHYITLNYIILHYITLRYVTLRYVALRCVTLRYVTLRYVTLRYITLHHITSHYITLHHITSHYMSEAQKGTWWWHHVSAMLSAIRFRIAHESHIHNEQWWTSCSSNNLLSFIHARSTQTTAMHYYDDYPNNTRGLQHVQKRPAQVICDIGVQTLHESGLNQVKSMALLKELHWLPVQSHIEFKVMMLCYKANRLATPSYLSSCLQPFIPRRCYVLPKSINC